MSNAELIAGLSEQIAGLRGNPQELERFYRTLGRRTEQAAFREAIADWRQERPDDPLAAAWHFRLCLPQDTAGGAPASRSPWAWAIALCLLQGLLFALALPNPSVLESLSDLTVLQQIVVRLWAPITATFVILFLAIVGRRPLARTVLILAGLAGLSAFAYFVASTDFLSFGEKSLMDIHLPFLAWIAVGVYVMGFHSPAEERFAFLSRTLDVIITCGLFLVVGAILVGLTRVLLFSLGVMPAGWSGQILQRLPVAGLFMIPLLALATVYDPCLSPASQPLQNGLHRVRSILLRLALPLAILALVIYLAFLPANFMRPFEERDVLIVYNLLLAAVLALLVGVIPLGEGELSDGLARWLRRGLLVLAGLTLLVCLYALAAVLYRTGLGGITPNRLTIIGWNIIAIGILILLLAKQLRPAGGGWLPALQQTFSIGSVVCAGWTIALTVGLPLIF